MQSCSESSANSGRFNSVERNTVGFRPLQPARGENSVCPLNEFSRRDRSVKSFDYKGHSRVKSVAEGAFCWGRKLSRKVQSRDSMSCFGPGSKKVQSRHSVPCGFRNTSFPIEVYSTHFKKNSWCKMKNITFLKYAFEHIWHAFTCENGTKSCIICSRTFLLKIEHFLKDTIDFCKFWFSKNAFE